VRRFVLLVIVLFAVAGCGSGAAPPIDLLFVSTRDGDYAIYGVAADGGHEHRVTKGRGDPSSPRGPLLRDRARLVSERPADRLREQA